MALPILESPKFTLTIPSTGKLIEYRPFLVKEEKILLIAQESDSQKDLINAMKDIIRACTYDKVDPNTLASFDLEYIFLKLRTKSVGETANIKIKCSKCEAYNPVEIDLDTVTVSTANAKDAKIMLSDTVGIKMRYVRIKDLDKISDDSKNKGDLIIDTIIASIDSIFDENGVYKTDETSREELIVFVNSLNRLHMAKIEEFIASTPKTEVTVDFKCTECEHENHIILNGIQSFFE